MQEMNGWCCFVVARQKSRNLCSAVTMAMRRSGLSGIIRRGLQHAHVWVATLSSRYMKMCTFLLMFSTIFCLYRFTLI